MTNRQRQQHTHHFCPLAYRSLPHDTTSHSLVTLLMADRQSTTTHIIPLPSLCLSLILHHDIRQFRNISYGRSPTTTTTHTPHSIPQPFHIPQAHPNYRITSSGSATPTHADCCNLRPCPPKSTHIIVASALAQPHAA